MHTLVKTNKGILLLLCLLGLISIYLYIHFQKIPAFSYVPVRESLLWVLPGLLAAALVAFAAWRRNILLGFILYLAGLYVVTDFAGMAIGSLARNTQLPQVWERLYYHGVMPFLAACATCLGGYVNARVIRVTPYAVKLQLLEDMAPLRVAMLSDMHLGIAIRPLHLPRIVEKVCAQQPDIIVLCGDIYEENTTRAQYEESLQALSRLRAPYGVYYVPGNHEYAAQAKGILEMDALEKDFAKIGITVLRDSALLVAGRFYLAGRDDAAGGSRASLEELLWGLDSRYPVILLDHRPVDMKRAAACGVSLQLSGHTHAGQLFPVRRFGERYCHSEMLYGHRSEGAFHALVSSGIGTWGFPLRIGSRSEVLVADLLPV